MFFGMDFQHFQKIWTHPWRNPGGIPSRILGKNSKEVFRRIIDGIPIEISEETLVRILQEISGEIH